MYELNRLGDKSWYINCYAKVGIYQQTETDVYIIDSGNDDEDAREIEKILKQKGWKLKGILNTHAHVDHMGGNSYIQSVYGCPAFSKGAEAAIASHTEIEPVITYGAHPFRDARSRSFFAESSLCYDVTHSEFPGEVEVIDLPGHSIEHVGYRLPDNTVFIGDSAAGDSLLAKYPILYVLNVGQYLESLEKLKALKPGLFVLSHGQVTSDIGPVAQNNIDNIRNICDRIENICSEPKNMGEILKAVFDRYGMNMNYRQYVLTLAIIRAFVSYLVDSGRIEGVVENNVMLWRKTL